MLGACPPAPRGVGRSALVSDSERPGRLVDGQGPDRGARHWLGGWSGRRPATGWRKGKSVGVSSGNGQPNRRLELSPPAR